MPKMPIKLSTNLIKALKYIAPCTETQDTLANEIREILNNIKTNAYDQKKKPITPCHIQFSEQSGLARHNATLDTPNDILTYKIWSLAITLLLHEIGSSSTSRLEDASNLFAWCATRCPRPACVYFITDPPPVLAHYMSNGMQFLCRGVYNVIQGNASYNENDFSPRRMSCYQRALVDFVMAWHIMKNEQRQVGAPCYLLSALYIQIEAMKDHVLFDSLAGNKITATATAQQRRAFVTTLRRLNTRLENNADHVIEPQKLHRTCNAWTAHLNVESTGWIWDYLGGQDKEAAECIDDTFLTIRDMMKNETVLAQYKQTSAKMQYFPFVPTAISAYKKYSKPMT